MRSQVALWQAKGGDWQKVIRSFGSSKPVDSVAKCIRPKSRLAPRWTFSEVRAPGSTDGRSPGR